MEKSHPDFYLFFMKIFLPSFIAIGVKIATKMRKQKVTYLMVLTSFIIGIGCAYFVYPFVEKNTDNAYLPLIVGIVSISGEKIAEYLIYRFDIDKVFNGILDILIEKFKK